MEKLKKLLNSANESNAIEMVAKEYGLDETKKKLLYAVRHVENGAQGKEFGVLVPEAMRFAKDPDPMKSFIIQAKWAAGTIRDRFNGDLKQFSKRWAPIGASNDPNNLNANWLKNVKAYMEKK